MATLGLQPTWFTPFHLFLTEKLLYYVFVDIFHSLVIPLIMARTIPWEPPKGRDTEFYVRQSDVLEPRRLISIQSEQRRVEPEGIKTMTLMKQNFKKTQKINNGTVFPKQAFRSMPLRMKGEMKIWRGANEFGHPVLFYSRHHGGLLIDWVWFHPPSINTIETCWILSWTSSNSWLGFDIWVKTVTENRQHKQRHQIKTSKS